MKSQRITHETNWTFFLTTGWWRTGDRASRPVGMMEITHTHTVTWPAFWCSIVQPHVCSLRSLNFVSAAVYSIQNFACTGTSSAFGCLSSVVVLSYDVTLKRQISAVGIIEITRTFAHARMLSLSQVRTDRSCRQRSWDEHQSDRSSNYVSLQVERHYHYEIRTPLSGGRVFMERQVAGLQEQRREVSCSRENCCSDGSGRFRRYWCEIQDQEYSVILLPGVKENPL